MLLIKVFVCAIRILIYVFLLIITEYSSKAFNSTLVLIIITPFSNNEVLALFILSSSDELSIQAVYSLIADFMRQCKIAPLVQALLGLYDVCLRNRI